MAGGVAEAARRGEDPGQGIVVPGEDRIELVVVAPGAGDGESEHGLGDDFDLLVVNVVQHALLVLLRDRFRAQGQETGGHDAAFVDRAGRFRRKQVSGDLLADEPVVGQVVVERLDDVVAVSPGVRIPVVLVVARGIGVAGDIQPVPAPAFPVERGGQQAVHDGLEGAGRVVRQERFGVGLGGRQARQVEGGPAQQGQLVGGRSGLEIPLLQLGEQKSVDRALRPIRVPRLRGNRVARGLERPIAALLFREPALFACRNHRRALRGAGPRRALQDPVPQSLDFVRRQLARGRHFHAALVADDREQAACLRRGARDQGGLVPRLDEALGAGQVDVAALELPVVAGLAAGGQQRAHMLLEILRAFRRGGAGEGERRREGGRREAAREERDRLIPAPHGSNAIGVRNPL